MCKNTVDEQVIPSCGAILSHFRSGRRGHLVTYWGFRSQNMCPKMWLPSFDLFDLCHPLDLWPQPIIFPLPAPRPSPASALLDNTPSIWRWRTTRTCTVKQLISGKELSSISCGSETSVFFCFFFFFLWTFVHFFTPEYSFFTMYYVHQSWVGRSRGGTLAWGSECDVSVTWLRPTSLKHACMQTSTHTRAGEARMGYKGGLLVFLFQKHTNSDWMEKETMTNNKKAGTGNGSGSEIKKKKNSQRHCKPVS